MWAFLTPFSGNIAIGANYNESFDRITNENETLTNIADQIALINTFSVPQRLSGRACQQETSTTTSLVTSGVVDEFNILLENVNNWRSLLTDQKNALEAVNLIDTSSTRVSENTTALANVDAAIAIVDTWLAIQNFDTTSPVGGGSSCAFFNGLTQSNFCLLYTSPSPRDRQKSRMPSSA